MFDLKKKIGNFKLIFFQRTKKILTENQSSPDPTFHSSFFNSFLAQNIWNMSENPTVEGAGKLGDIHPYFLNVYLHTFPIVHLS